MLANCYDRKRIQNDLARHTLKSVVLRMYAVCNFGRAIIGAATDNLKMQVLVILWSHKVPAMPMEYKGKLVS